MELYRNWQVVQYEWQDVRPHSWAGRPKVTPAEMDKKKAVDDTEPGPAPSRAVDRFGFIKPEQSNNSPEGISKSRLLHERER